MSRSIRALVLAALVAGATCKRPDPEKPPWHDHDSIRYHMERHHEEMKHLNKIHKDHEEFECSWTVHKDVDDSIYFFSRLLKRSEREPPKSWRKNDMGEWQPPAKCKRGKEEL